MLLLHDSLRGIRERDNRLVFFIISDGAVGKGELRVVTRAFVCPGRWTQFVRHMNCVSASLARQIVAVHGSTEAIPVGAGVDADAAEAARVKLRQSTCLS